MDCWHTSTEPVWVSIELIWNAISSSNKNGGGGGCAPIDSESQKQRGLLLIEHIQYIHSNNKIKHQHYM